MATEDVRPRDNDAVGANAEAAAASIRAERTTFIVGEEIMTK